MQADQAIIRILISSSSITSPSPSSSAAASYHPQTTLFSATQLSTSNNLTAHLFSNCTQKTTFPPSKLSAMANVDMATITAAASKPSAPLFRPRSKSAVTTSTCQGSPTFPALQPVKANTLPVTTSIPSKPSLSDTFFTSFPIFSLFAPTSASTSTSSLSSALPPPSSSFSSSPSKDHLSSSASNSNSTHARSNTRRSSSHSYTRPPPLNHIDPNTAVLNSNNNNHKSRPRYRNRSVTATNGSSTPGFFALITGASTSNNNTSNSNHLSAPSPSSLSSLSILPSPFDMFRKRSQSTEDTRTSSLQPQPLSPATDNHHSSKTTQKSPGHRHHHHHHRQPQLPPQQQQQQHHHQHDPDQVPKSLRDLLVLAQSHYISHRYVQALQLYRQAAEQHHSLPACCSLYALYTSAQPIPGLNKSDTKATLALIHALKIWTGRRWWDSKHGGGGGIKSSVRSFSSSSGGSSLYGSGMLAKDSTTTNQHVSSMAESYGSFGLNAQGEQQDDDELDEYFADGSRYSRRPKVTNTINSKKNTSKSMSRSRSGSHRESSNVAGKRSISIGGSRRSMDEYRRRQSIGSSSRGSRGSRRSSQHYDSNEEDDKVSDNGQVTDDDDGEGEEDVSHNGDREEDEYDENRFEAEDNSEEEREEARRSGKATAEIEDIVQKLCNMIQKGVLGLDEKIVLDAVAMLRKLERGLSKEAKEWQQQQDRIRKQQLALQQSSLGAAIAAAASTTTTAGGGTYANDINNETTTFSTNNTSSGHLLLSKGVDLESIMRNLDREDNLSSPHEISSPPATSTTTTPTSSRSQATSSRSSIFSNSNSSTAFSSLTSATSSSLTFTSDEAEQVFCRAIRIRVLSTLGWVHAQRQEFHFAAVAFGICGDITPSVGRYQLDSLQRQAREKSKQCRQKEKDLEREQIQAEQDRLQQFRRDLEERKRVDEKRRKKMELKRGWKRDKDGNDIFGDSSSMEEETTNLNSRKGSGVQVETPSSITSTADVATAAVAAPQKTTSRKSTSSSIKTTTSTVATVAVKSPPVMTATSTIVTFPTLTQGSSHSLSLPPISTATATSGVALDTKKKEPLSTDPFMGLQLSEQEQRIMFAAAMGSISDELLVTSNSGPGIVPCDNGVPCVSTECLLPTSPCMADGNQKLTDQSTTTSLSTTQPIMALTNSLETLLMETKQAHDQYGELRNATDSAAVDGSYTDQKDQTRAWVQSTTGRTRSKSADLGQGGIGSSIQRTQSVLEVTAALRDNHDLEKLKRSNIVTSGGVKNKDKNRPLHSTTLSKTLSMINTHQLDQLQQHYHQQPDSIITNNPATTITSGSSNNNSQTGTTTNNTTLTMLQAMAHSQQAHCGFCGKTRTLMPLCVCKKVHYCNRDCRAKDLENHRITMNCRGVIGFSAPTEGNVVSIKMEEPQQQLQAVVVE